MPPGKIKELADEIVYKQGGRIFCSSFCVNSDKTLNLGCNGILSIDGVENSMVRERVGTYIDEIIPEGEGS